MRELIEKLKREHEALGKLPMTLAVLKAGKAEKVINVLVAVVIEQQEQIEQLTKEVKSNGN